jgi:signal transduction histidine kinase
MATKSPFVVRLWFLIIALLLVAGGMIFELAVTWRRVQQLGTKLNSAEIERFQLATEIRRDLLALNESMLSYVLVRDPQEWARFQQAGTELDRWIDDHDPSLNPHSPLTTEGERRAFKQLNDAYDDYLASARAIHSNALPALVNSNQLAQLDPFNLQAQRMRDLVRLLANAHRSAEAGFFANANAALSHVQLVLLASLVLLLGLVAAMGWVIYHDMIAPLRTRLVQNQSLLEKQEKLATLGTLAAGIAHEIRNPLTALKARLYTLQKNLSGQPAARRDTEIIGSEISRLEHIVRDVLSFARPSEPKMETIAAETVIREVDGLMAPSLEGRGVQLVVESSPGLYIRADSGHLKQVLVNLVRNAAEAIDGVGTVTLRTRSTRSRLGGRDVEAVLLEVADDGKGVPPEVEERLFDPFFSTKDTGTGLGLPIAVRMVEKLGGMLQYDTRQGRGTTFTIVLPRELETPRNAIYTVGSAQ